jgi:hypothetical protein
MPSKEMRERRSKYLLLLYWMGLAECPSVEPPWWKIGKWLKWRRVWNQQFG